MRFAFQTMLLLVAFLPFLLGAITLFEGALRFVSEDMITAELDNQIRFSAIRSMLPFFLTVWIVRNLEEARAVLAIVLWATAAGGLARVYSAAQYGLPGPTTAGVIALEIGVLLFIPWYRAVVRPPGKRVDVQ